MDLDRTIRDLLEERKRLNALITRLENQQSRTAPKRRGRKSMTEAQRREVSERMKRYWQEKRQAAS
jgi:hypothetical protein